MAGKGTRRLSEPMQMLLVSVGYISLKTHLQKKGREKGQIKGRKGVEKKTNKQTIHCRN